MSSTDSDWMSDSQPDERKPNPRDRLIHHPPYIINDNIVHPLRSPPSLCYFCKSLIEQRDQFHETEEHKFDHYDDITSLKESARGGCGLCAQFEAGEMTRDTLWGCNPYDGDRRGGFAYWVKYESGTMYKKLRLYVPHTVEQPYIGLRYLNRYGLVQFEILMVPAHEPGEVPARYLWAYHRRHLFLALGYDSVETVPSTLDGLQIAQKWLRSCIETHRECELIESKLKIPTRLIAINETSLKLRETKDLVGRFRYATLSHCWGGKVFLRLAKNKLTSFRVDIPHEELPKTFQDAIFIARYLGFQYLWIDSLCIIQDDKDDWDRESTLMTDVYGGSDLNIAAVSAKDGSVGCFFQRDRKWRSQLTLASDGMEMLYDVLPANMQSPRRTPLFHRGWVIQERYLSRRSLYFHEHQIFWDCREHSKCESTNSESHVMRSLVMSPLLFGSPFMSGEITLDNWWTIVQRYSRMRLTRATDRLVAIGGLAKAIQAQIGDGYFSGMWRRDLELQLLWYGRSLAENEAYVAPTWSWASLGTPCALYAPDELKLDNFTELCVQICDANVEYASSGAFGQVKGAVIRMSCKYLHSANIKYSSRGAMEGVLLVDKEEVYIETWLNSAFPKSKAARDASGSDTSDIQNARQDTTTDEDGSDPRSAETTVEVMQFYMLPITATKWDPITAKRDGHRGLMLEKTNAQQGQYRRVGMYVFPDGRPGTESWLLDISTPTASDCAEIVVDEAGETNFMIDII